MRTHKNFFMVPNRIFELNLKPRELAVYCCPLRHCNDNMTCFPSRKLIGAECSIDRKTVDLALKNLKDIGLI
ncbi:MAG: helix-turn-helix domain-containing protein [Clostridia bacterium]|nr:helix-turn-helix domain-containing protein [Clostridia bacterium]